MKRNKIYLNVLACFGIAMGLSACGGGSFDTLEVHTELPKFAQPTKKVEKSGEPRQNPEQQEALKQSAAGFALRNIRRNQAKYDDKGEAILDANGKPMQAEQHVALNPDNIIPLNHNDLSNPLVDMLNAAPNRSGTAKHTDEKFQTEYQYIRFGHAADGQAQSDFSYTTNSKGERQNNIFRQGWNVYTFYHGINPSRTLPTQDNVQYKGQWHFMSDVTHNKAKKEITKEDAARPDYQHGNGFSRFQDGDIASALADTYGGNQVKFDAEFTVNFNDKQLTGNLKHKSANDPERTVYKIDANIKNNRFTGKAKSQVDSNSPHLHQEFFDAHSDHVEGGFYGDNGAEMAGKFLTNDNSLFAVFGAKQENPESVRKNDAVLFDAHHINKPARTTEEYTDPEDKDETILEGAEETEENTNEIPDNTVENEGEENREGEANSGDVNTANSEDAANGEEGASERRVAANTHAAADDAESDEDKDSDAEAEEEKEYLLERDHLSKVERKPTFNTGNALTLRFGTHSFDISRAEYISVSKTDDNKDKEWISVCCSQLDYLRFGEFNLIEKIGGTPVNALYLQGERTPLANMTQSGKAKYIGTWTGFISVAEANKNVYGNPDYKHSANWGTKGASSTATFDVDFDNKSLTGSLFGAGALKVFDITASIKGNGFSGTAKTDGDFSFDAGSQLKGYSARINNAKVEGGFYGPDAQELGGSLIYNSRVRSQFHKDVRAGAVFGATKEVVKEQK